MIEKGKNRRIEEDRKYTEREKKKVCTKQEQQTEITLKMTEKLLLFVRLETIKNKSLPSKFSYDFRRPMHVIRKLILFQRRISVSVCVSNGNTVYEKALGYIFFVETLCLLKMIRTLLICANVMAN